jgi:PAS domain-containing protein
MIVRSSASDLAISSKAFPNSSSARLRSLISVTKLYQRTMRPSVRWFLFRASPLRNDSGKVVKWNGTNTDLEDRKRAEDALRSNEQSLRLIVDSIPGIVSTLNAAVMSDFYCLAPRLSISALLSQYLMHEGNCD